MIRSRTMFTLCVQCNAQQIGGWVDKVFFGGHIREGKGCAVLVAEMMWLDASGFARIE